MSDLRGFFCIDKTLKSSTKCVLSTGWLLLQKVQEVTPAFIFSLKSFRKYGYNTYFLKYNLFSILRFNENAHLQ